MHTRQFCFSLLIVVLSIKSSLFYIYIFLLSRYCIPHCLCISHYQSKELTCFLFLFSTCPRYFYPYVLFSIHRCPNLPVPEEALPIIEPPGFTTLESKLSNRRWAKKRFPKPPEAFLTHLW